MLKTSSSLDTGPRGPFFGIYLSDLSQKLAFKAAEGTTQPSKGGRQPTILLSYDTYVPHWQVVWPSKPHGSVVAHVIFCSSIVRYRTCSTRWKLYVFFYYSYSSKIWMFFIGSLGVPYVCLLNQFCNKIHILHIDHVLSILVEEIRINFPYIYEKFIKKFSMNII